MLRQQNLPVLETALTCGFSHMGHFHYLYFAIASVFLRINIASNIAYGINLAILFNMAWSSLRLTGFVR